MKKSYRPAWLWLLLSVLWTGFIFVRSLQPAEVSSAESSLSLVLLQRIFPGASMFFVRKAAHFAEYLILGLLLGAGFRTVRRCSVFLPLIPAIGVAASDELIQTMIPGRSGQVSDVLLDLSGTAAACVLAAVWVWLRKRKKRRQT